MLLMSANSTDRRLKKTEVHNYCENISLQTNKLVRKRTKEKRIIFLFMARKAHKTKEVHKEIKD